MINEIKNLYMSFDIMCGYHSFMYLLSGAICCDLRDGEHQTQAFEGEAAS